MFFLIFLENGNVCGAIKWYVEDTLKILFDGLHVWGYVGVYCVSIEGNEGILRD